MSKIDHLYQYLISLGFVNRGEINRIADQKTTSCLKLHLRNETQPGRLLSVKDYSGIIYIDGFAEKTYSEDEVLAIINIWLAENDHFYNPALNINSAYPIGITLSNTPLDLSTSYLEITVQFHELLVLIEDVTGKITMDGKKYRLANSSLAAENFEDDFLQNTGNK